MIERSISWRFQLLGTIALALFHATHAGNETFNGYFFTLPDQPDTADSRITQSNANQWCQSNKNKLLEIYDSQLQGIVTQFIYEKGGQNGKYSYLGNIQIFTNGMRTGMASSCTWVNGQGYTAVGPGILNQDKSENICVYLAVNQSGIFYILDNPAANKRGYICEVEASPGSTCSSGFKYGNRCYTSSTDQLSWYQARNRCLNDGGDLASFDFVTDLQSLNSLNGPWINPSTPYWIGLRRQWWKWQGSDSEIKYTNWQEGRPQPNPQSPPPNCLCLMSPQRDWSECDCNQNNQFICAMRLNNDASTSTRPTTAIPYRNTSSTVPWSIFSTPTSSKSFSASSRSYASTINSSPDKGNSTSVNPESHAVPLGVGLGVGLGGLLIIIIIIVVVLLVRKRRHRKFGNSHNQRRFQTPDILNIAQEDKYATVERKLDYDGVDLKTNDTKTIYAMVQPTANQTVL